MKKQKNNPWDYLEDTPEEFDAAIKNAVSDKEREFFEKLRYKILHETAFSNDVLMHEKDNEDSLYILRVGTDDIMIGRNLEKPGEKTSPVEITGLFAALEDDIYEYMGRHITLLDWLRERDYRGINYDANNDYR